MKEFKVYESQAKYIVSYESGSQIKKVTVWKEPASGRLEIQSAGKIGRYSLERLIFSDGNASAVYRKVRRSGNKIVGRLYDLDSLMKELKYFGGKFKSIFDADSRIKAYAENHFHDLHYCWKNKLIWGK